MAYDVADQRRRIHALGELCFAVVAALDLDARQVGSRGRIDHSRDEMLEGG